MKYSNLEIFTFVLVAALAIACILLIINTIKTYYTKTEEPDTSHLNSLKEELQQLQAEAKALEEQLNK